MKDKYYEQAVTCVRPVWKDTYVYAITEDEYEKVSKAALMRACT